MELCSNRVTLGLRTSWNGNRRVLAYADAKFSKAAFRNWRKLWAPRASKQCRQPTWTRPWRAKTGSFVLNVWNSFGAPDQKSNIWTVWCAPLKFEDPTAREAAIALGKLGAKAGLAADELLVLAGGRWQFGCPQCYEHALNALVKIAPDDPHIIDVIRNTYRCDAWGLAKVSIVALQTIATPAANVLLGEVLDHWTTRAKSKSAKAALEGARAALQNATPTSRNVGPAQQSESASWLPFSSLEAVTGALWAGDPYLANEEDGCIVKVPPGKYLVEVVDLALAPGRAVSKLRVRLETEANPVVGDQLGEAGTDSAMIGVCDKAFLAAIESVSHEEMCEHINAQTEDGCGVVALEKFPGVAMSIICTGSDGIGPVYALLSGDRCVGIELPFTDDEDG